MYYGVDYYPEHWPRERWEIDARLMRESHMNIVRMAEFAWAQLEPEEERYDFCWLDEAIELLGRHGISTVLGTPTATPPAWLCQRYPEILRWDRDRQRVTFGMRRQYCPTNDTYRRLSSEIVRAMAEHYAGNPYVIGWQLDNEFGCHDTTRCYCPSCLLAFQNWTRRRHRTLDALNDAWGTAFWSHCYTSWEQIPLPWSTTGTSNPCLELDYYRFASEEMVAYAQLQTDILREACPNHFVTTNLMGYRFQDMDYFDLVRPLDLVSWDNYPIYAGHQDSSGAALSHDLMRSLRDRPFWVMEQQAGPAGWQTMTRAPKPGELALLAYQAIAHGADGIVFFRWRTCRFNTEEYWHGVLDHDGEPRRRYDEISAMGRQIAKIGQRIEGTMPPKQVAILFSYDDSWALHLQPGAPGLSYSRVVGEYYRAFHKLGVSIDVVSANADLTPYKIVVAPLLHVVPKALAAKLEQYVRAGGYLLLGARSGVKDESNRVVNMPLPGLFADLCGCDVWEYDAIGAEASNSVRLSLPGRDEQSVPVDTWCDILRLHEAELVAAYEQDFYDGEPAIALNRVGSGCVLYVGVMGGQGLCAPLAVWLCEEADCQAPVVPGEDVEVAVRGADDSTLIFVLNYSSQEKSLAIPFAAVDLLSEKRWQNQITVPAGGVAILAKE